MDPQLITGVTVFLCFVALSSGLLAVELILLGGVTVLMCVGVLTPEQAVEGFGNPAVLTIGGLYVLTAALRQTGALDLLFGDPPHFFSSFLEDFFPSVETKISFSSPG